MDSSSKLHPTLDREMELHQEFKTKFGQSPTVDHDQMPHHQWMAHVEQAVSTGVIPPALKRLMGFKGDLAR